jgi:hypothetical protein
MASRELNVFKNILAGRMEYILYSLNRKMLFNKYILRIKLKTDLTDEYLLKLRLGCNY